MHKRHCAVRGQARKQERCTVDTTASFDEADVAAEGVRLRVEMQRAVEEERCAPGLVCALGRAATLGEQLPWLAPGAGIKSADSLLEPFGPA